MDPADLLMPGVLNRQTHGPSSSAAALIERGWFALHEAGDLRLSRHCFELACRTAEQVGDREALAEGAIGLGGIWLHEHRNSAVRARVQSWQARAASTAPIGGAHDLLLRARLSAESDYLAGRHERAFAVLDEARLGQDPRVQAEVLSLVHHCVLGPGHARIRAELAQEMLLTAARTERRFDRLFALMWRGVDQFLDADPQARRSLAELSVELEDGEHLAISFVAQAMQVMLAIRAGEFERAEKLAADCYAAGERCGDADAGSWYSAQMLAIRWFQGRITDMLPMLNGQVHAPGLSAIDEAHIAGLAVAAAAGGGHREAAGALARLGRGDLTNIPRSSAWLITLYGAVEAAAKLTDRETARTAYDLLKPYAHLPMIGSLAVTCFGSVEHALGVASLTMGKLEQGIAHLRRAVRANLALEHWPAACLSRFRLAQAIAMRGGEADLAEAAREQAAANHEASRLGMPLPSNQRIPAVTPEPVLSLQPPMLPDPDAGKTEDAGGTGAVDTSGGAETAEGETGITADDTLDLTEVIEEATQMTEAVASRGWASTEVEDQRADEIAGEGAQAELAGPGGSQIQLLGPLEVLVDGRPRPVLGHRRRTVLAILALHAGEIVSVDRLIDIVWGDRPPRTAVNTVQSHVSYLRRVIGDKGAILGRPPGYLLDLGPAGTDVATAEGLIRAGSRAADPAERVRHLLAALGLWRGRPLVDVTSSPWLDLQAERLNQLLLQAHQMLAEARLALGETSLLTVELRPLIREHPLAERLHGYLMLALYREGRQGEALEVYQRLRAVLSSELGVEPTEPLRTLQLAILRQDPVVPII
jgi:DNA-binding SARP family transcriptional activator